jgi:hypothetical protein
VRPTRRATNTENEAPYYFEQALLWTHPDLLRNKTPEPRILLLARRDAGEAVNLRVVGSQRVTAYPELPAYPVVSRRPTRQRRANFRGSDRIGSIRGTPAG